VKRKGVISLKNLRNGKALSTLIVLIIVSVIVVAAIGAVVIYFWFIPGQVITQEKEYSDFTSVDVGSAFQVDITQSNSYSVVIKASETILDKIDVTKEGSTLMIRAEPNIPITAVYKAEITMPNLTELVLSGASKGTVEGFSSSDPLGLKISAASRLDMQNTHAGNVEIELSGASTFIAEGSGNDLVSVVEGASKLDLTSFQVNNGNLEVSGASQATVNLDGTLDAVVSGASTLYYIGEPTMGHVETSGSSSINKK
jgi:hypothetical protein